MFHKVMYWIFFLIFNVQTQAIKLTLNEYDQSDSETRCTQGLLQGKDYAVFKGTFNWEGSSPDYSRVVELGLKADHLSYIDIFCVIPTGDTCRGHEGRHHCYCERVDGDKTFHLIFNITATTSVSRAEIRLQVSHINKSQIFSDTRIMPEIFDSSKSILINDLVPETEFCFLKFNTTNVVITSCCHNLPQPCISTISRNSLKVASSDVCSSYLSRDVSSRASIYKVTVSVCGDERYVQPLTCIAEYDAQLSVAISCEYSKANFGICLAILILILIKAIIYMQNKSYRLCFEKCIRGKHEEDTTEEQHL